MKNIIILLSLILTACSNNNSSSPKETPSEEVYNLDSYGIGFFTGSPLVDNPVRVDMLTVTQGSRKSLAITIKNTSAIATVSSTATLSDTKFYITSSTCASKSIPAGGSCTLTLNFSAIGKAPQPFESTLQFASSSIPVKIEVVAATTSSAAAVIKMYDATTLISSPPDYSIGSVSGTAKISKVITIKNEGTDPSLVGDAYLSSSDFYLSSNSCVSKVLNPAASCSVTVNFSATGKAPGSRNTLLMFGGAQVSLEATVSSPPAPAPAQLVFMDGANNLSQDLHLGPYSANVTLSKTLSVKNIGGSSSSSLSLQLLNNPSGFYVISNSCSNISLSPGASCSFNLRVSTTGKAAGMHSVQLKMDQTTQVVDFERLIPTYTLTLSIAGPGSVSFNSQTYTSSQYFTLPSGYGISLLSSPVANGQITYTGGTCASSSNAPLGCSATLDSNRTIEVTFSCQSGFIENNGVCEAASSISSNFYFSDTDNYYVYRYDSISQSAVIVDDTECMVTAGQVFVGSVVYYQLYDFCEGEFLTYKDHQGTIESFPTSIVFEFSSNSPSARNNSEENKLSNGNVIVVAYDDSLGEDRVFEVSEDNGFEEFNPNFTPLLQSGDRVLVFNDRVIVSNVDGSLSSVGRSSVVQVSPYAQFINSEHFQYMNSSLYLYDDTQKVLLKTSNGITFSTVSIPVGSTISSGFFFDNSFNYASYNDSLFKIDKFSSVNMDSGVVTTLASLDLNEGTMPGCSSGMTTQGNSYLYSDFAKKSTDTGILPILYCDVNSPLMSTTLSILALKPGIVFEVSQDPVILSGRVYGLHQSNHSGHSHPIPLFPDNQYFRLSDGQMLSDQSSIDFTFKELYAHTISKIPYVQSWTTGEVYKFNSNSNNFELISTQGMSWSPYMKKMGNKFIPVEYSSGFYIDEDFDLVIMSEVNSIYLDYYDDY